MPLDIRGIQKNPVAVSLAGLFTPASGTPKKLVHAIEPFVLDALTGDRPAAADMVNIATRRTWAARAGPALTPGGPRDDM
jgi:hypothetical protein